MACQLGTIDKRCTGMHSRPNRQLDTSAYSFVFGRYQLLGSNGSENGVFGLLKVCKSTVSRRVE